MGCRGTATTPLEEALWYSPGGDKARTWKEMQTSFGRGRDKPYRRGAITRPCMNRKGNENGELAGQIVFYQSSSSTCDYGRLQKISTSKEFLVAPERKLFAKGFLDVPLGRNPIGENIIKRKASSKHARRHRGPVLLAAVPRIIAVFITIDGVPQCQQILHKHKLHDDEEEDSFILQKALPGSFFTHVVSRIQDEFCFVHLPLVAKHADTTFVTGDYGADLIEAFCKLLHSLSPGQHVINMKLRYYYDNRVFNYLPLERNLNPLGLWFSGLNNDDLTQPHTSPEIIYTTEAPLANGTVTIRLVADLGSSWSLEGISDRQPPTPEYSGKDLDDITRDAKMLSGYALTRQYDVTGLPDLIIVTSEKVMRHTARDQFGKKHTFEYVEFTAAYLNKQDKREKAKGNMLHCCMARGELRPRRVEKDWKWMPLLYPGRDTEAEMAWVPDLLRVQNRYIHAGIELMKKKLTLAGFLNRLNSSIKGGWPTSSKA